MNAMQCETADIAVQRIYIGGREVARIRPLFLFADNEKARAELCVYLRKRDEFGFTDCGMRFNNWSDAHYFLRVQLSAFYKREIAAINKSVGGWLSETPTPPFTPRNFIADC